MINSIAAVSVAILLMVLAGCAPLMSLRTPGSEKWPLEFKVGDIVDTKKGEVITFENLMRDLAGAQVIYVGETHTSREDHRIQLKVAEGLYAEDPSLVLAMEMFPRSDQAVLNRYSQGELSEADFLKQSEWQKVWGYPFDLYRGLLDFARERHLQVIGLNIPPGLSHKISQSGIASLTPEERAQVAQQFDYGNAEHRNYVRQEFEQHGKFSIKDFETFYEAQLAWEETMAETLAQEIASLKKGQQILVIIGKGHVNYRFGVPMRAWERIRHVYKIIIPLPINYPGTIADPKLADYVWVTKQMESAHKGLLGVMIRALTPAAGLEVLAVEPDSPADKAGIEKGDILLQVDGVALKSVEQLQKAVAAGGKVHDLMLKRGTRKITVTVTIGDETQER